MVCVHDQQYLCVERTHISTYIQCNACRLFALRGRVFLPLSSTCTFQVLTVLQLILTKPFINFRGLFCRMSRDLHNDIYDRPLVTCVTCQKLMHNSQSLSALYARNLSVAAQATPHQRPRHCINTYHSCSKCFKSSCQVGNTRKQKCWRMC